MNFLVRTWIGEWLIGLGRIAVLARDAIASIFTLKLVWRDLLYQLYYIGLKSQSVVLVTGGFTGMVLTGKPVGTIIRGARVMWEGALAERGAGRPVRFESVEFG